MTPSLMNKLRMMDAEQKPRSLGGDPEAGPTAEEQKPKAPECYHLRETFPLSVFGDRSHATPAGLSAVFGLDVPRRITEKDFLFLDTETTGLSGGVGTVAFQVGLGYFQDHQFVVEQFLIRDYHEEPFMLGRVAELASRFRVLVSFNGRAYDVPLLKNRFIMNRLREHCLPELHADLLMPARRLWKLRLGSCRLSHLEEALLGVHREDDISGALVPQTFFQYLKNRNFAPMERILAHNRQDIVSLAQLFFFLMKEVARPEEMIHSQDLLSLARHHEKQGHTQQAVKCYRLCAHGQTRPQAFASLALHEKRQGQADHAIRLYSAMLRRGDDPAAACEALSKLYEHQKKDWATALHYTRQALLLLSEPGLTGSASVQDRRNALQYRYARLKRKQDLAPQPCTGGISPWD